MQEKLFNLSTEFKPAGDQVSAIPTLCEGLKKMQKNQTLLGVTGSGKTFTMANVIAKTNRPALILAHNKTLAAQLYSEMRSFFPDAAVEYFVSYYDYYQPEAYIPKTDTYIEKDSSINEQIEIFRNSTTRNLLTRKDVIVVSSVSCIYGLGSKDSYQEMSLDLKKNQNISFDKLTEEFVRLQYSRNDLTFSRGDFRVKGDIVDIFPSHMETSCYRLYFFGNEIEDIFEIDPLINKKLKKLDKINIFACSHYATPEKTLKQAQITIKEELKERLAYLKKIGNSLEYARLEAKTNFDLEMMEETGGCKGIENYSRHLTGRKEGDPPPTLFEYLPKDAILFVDESHAMLPQIRAMYNGDRARKTNLVEHGFRLPSALDNRPLKFEEWDEMRPNTIFVSATPAIYELELSKNQFARQVIRPTGLVDPVCVVRPLKNQVDDVIEEIHKVIKQGFRILVTTLTKKMAENLADYLSDLNIKVEYLHSDVKTLERVEIIGDLKKGVIDVLVGVNLLREGLDIPECALVAILDADKEGFLRSATALIQTIGRASRNTQARVILYADKMTNSMTIALNETNNRREIQIAHNKKHNITPKTIIKDNFEQLQSLVGVKVKRGIKEVDEVINLSKSELDKRIKDLYKEMMKYANDLKFEKATDLRDEIQHLEKLLLLE